MVFSMSEDAAYFWTKDVDGHTRLGLTKAAHETLGEVKYAESEQRFSERWSDQSRFWIQLSNQWDRGCGQPGVEWELRCVK